MLHFLFIEWCKRKFEKYATHKLGKMNEKLTSPELTDQIELQFNWWHQSNYKLVTQSQVRFFFFTLALSFLSLSLSLSLNFILDSLDRMWNKRVERRKRKFQTANKKIYFTETQFESLSQFDHIFSLSLSSFRTKSYSIEWIWLLDFC